MGLKCKITYSEQGVAKVVDTQGKESELYNKIFDAVEDQDLALEIWATAYTEDLGRAGESASIEDLMRFYDSAQAGITELSKEDIFSIKDFMGKNGIESLDELNQKLQTIFKPEGILDFNTSAALSSGLFSTPEISELDESTVKEILLKIEGHLVKDNFKATPQNTEYNYKDSSTKTVFGTYARVSQKEIDIALLEAVEDFTSKESFDKAVDTLPFSEFVEKYKLNKKFAQETRDKFKDLKRVPLMHTTVEGMLVPSEDNTLTTVRNTVVVKGNVVELEAELDYLDEMSSDIWNNNQTVVKAVLKDVEKTFLKNSIDVIGISSISKDRGGVMFLLEQALELAKKPTQVTIREFSEAYNRILTPQKQIVVEKVPEQYKNYNVVKVFSNQNEGVLFDKFGLIQIGENLYQSVDQSADINDIRDYIYNQMKKGELTMPKRFRSNEDFDNKPQVLEDISRYLMSREMPSQVVSKELYSGYQVAFGHTPIKKNTKKLTKIGDIQSDPAYLKGGFITDFYKYILEEKQKNSNIYKEVLSKFSFEDNDIILKQTIDNIENIRFKGELQDYISLKKDSSMDYLLDESTNTLTEDTVALNNPERYKNIEGNIIQTGNYIVTEQSTDEYIKYNNEMYRKVSEDMYTSAYLKVFPDTDAVYNDKGENFDYNTEEANAIRRIYNENKTSNTSLEQSQRIEAESKVTSLPADLQAFSTMEDLNHGFTIAGTSVHAYLGGEVVGNITFEKVEDGFGNERVNVNETHRGHGIGTELYLRMLNVMRENNTKFYPNKKETKQSKNILGRISNMTTQNADGSISFITTIEEKTIGEEALNDIVTALNTLPENMISEAQASQLVEYAKKFEKPMLVFKGLDGKKGVNGDAINVHSIPNTVWGSKSYTDAKSYARKTGRVAIFIEEGLNSEVVKAPSNIGISKKVEVEKELILNSKADIVILDTVDSTTKTPHIIFKNKVESLGVINEDTPLALDIKEVNKITVAPQTSEKTAEEVYELDQAKKLNDNPDRFVQEVPTGILKQADNSAGKIQNAAEGILSIMPKVIEKGSDYVVVEKIQTENSSKLDTFVGEINKYGPDAWDNKDEALQKTLEKYGVQEILNPIFEISYGDIIAGANWGIKGNQIMMLDGGSLVTGNSYGSTAEFYATIEIANGVKNFNTLNKVIVEKEIVNSKNQEQDYQNLLNKTKSIFNSNIEVLSLYTSKEETSINKEIDNCG